MSVSDDLERCRLEGEPAGEVVRDPYVVVRRLIALYGALPPADRAEADRVFAHWLTSPHDAIWHLGLTMINRLQILGAIPDLVRLADRFRGSRQPGSDAWVEAVDNIATELRSISEEEPWQYSERN